MHTRTILMLTTGLLLLAGCYYDNEEALYPQLSGGCDTTNVTFAGSIVPILSANCYACHSDANAPQFGNNIHLQSYSDVKTNLDRLYSAVTWQPGFVPMPQNSAQISDCAIRTIEIWMAQGAPDSAVPAGGAR